MSHLLYYLKNMGICFLCTYAAIDLISRIRSRIIRKRILKTGEKGSSSEKIDNSPEGIPGGVMESDCYASGILLYALISGIIFVIAVMGYSYLVSVGIIQDRGGALLVFCEFFAGLFAQLIYYLIGLVCRKLPVLRKNEITLLWLVVLVFLAFEFISMQMPAQGEMCIALLLSCFLWVGLPEISSDGVREFINGRIEDIEKILLCLHPFYIGAVIVFVLGSNIVVTSANDPLYMLLMALASAFGIVAHEVFFQAEIWGIFHI